MHGDRLLDLDRASSVQAAPAVTVVREASEELGIESSFYDRVGRGPFFLSERVTVGLTAGRTDVSL